MENKMDEIRIYPDPILMKKAVPVQEIDGQVKEIVDRMVEAMYAKRGIGLAAPKSESLARLSLWALEMVGRHSSILNSLRGKRNQFWRKDV